MAKKWAWSAMALATVAPLACAAGPAHPARKPAHASPAVKSVSRGHAALRSSSVSTKSHGHAASGKALHGGKGSHPVVAHATAETQRLSAAFVASAQLRPMAQQLAALRTGAAYNGVLAYAAAHPGEAGAAADLALGHAYSLDKRYPEAEGAFRQAIQQGQALSDYAEFLGAQAALAANKPADTMALLNNFAERHAGSLFVPQGPMLLANAYLAQNDPASAIRTLQPSMDTPTGSHVDFRMTLAKAYAAAGQTDKAAAVYRSVYIGDPLSNEATTAKAQLAALNVPLTPAERKRHADSMFDSKHYEIAAVEYRALRKDEEGLSQADRDALQIYAAVCDLKLKRLGRGDVEHLPVTSDDTAALKLYLQSELARNEGNTSEHDALVAQMSQQYPNSRWLEEALYSGGNMYLIKRDPTRAIADYAELVTRFPRSVYAPSAHWRAAWLNYRLRRYPDAARM